MIPTWTCEKQFCNNCEIVSFKRPYQENPLHDLNYATFHGNRKCRPSTPRACFIFSSKSFCSTFCGTLNCFRQDDVDMGHLGGTTLIVIPSERTGAPVTKRRKSDVLYPWELMFCKNVSRRRVMGRTSGSFAFDMPLIIAAGFGFIFSACRWTWWRGREESRVETRSYYYIVVVAQEESHTYIHIHKSSHDDDCCCCCDPSTHFRTHTTTQLHYMH